MTRLFQIAMALLVAGFIVSEADPYGRLARVADSYAAATGQESGK